jgi:GNAT superfamily N-acetyltransferase
LIGALPYVVAEEVDADGSRTAAIATSAQGQKLGADLLKDAMLRKLQGADIAGLRALAVHAKDDEAKRFYEHFDFIPSPSDPIHLSVLRRKGSAWHQMTRPAIDEDRHSRWAQTSASL